MPWVRFLEEFDWKPKPAVTVAFKTGTVKLVTRACAEKALAAGKAVPARSPEGVKLNG